MIINSQFKTTQNLAPYPLQGRKAEPASLNLSPIQDQIQLTALKKGIPTLPLFQSPTNSPYLETLQKIQHQPKTREELPDFDITPLKIGMAIQQTSSQLTLEAAEIKVGQNSLGTFENATVNVLATPRGIHLQINQQTLGPFKEKIIIENSATALKINGKSYRGNLEIIAAPQKPGTFNLINDVMLEDYLKGVVPAESPASWSIESLKAQAVAARTYAVANWQKRSDQGFDLMPTTSDQVYKGVEVEHPNSSQAVEETSGQILTFNGQPINALFAASSGGHTDSALEVWGVDLPYIKGVPDFDQNSPVYRWNKTMSQTQLQQALRKLNIQIGSIEAIQIKHSTPVGRVKQIIFKGSQGEAIIDANKFRFAARLKSTLWNVQPQKQSFVFNGGGWGHGLGLSQWGAKQMAEDGKNYQEILNHYYTQITLEEL